MRPQFRSVIRELGGALGRLGYGSVTTIRPVPAWGTSTSSAAVDSSKTSAAPRSVVNGSRGIPRQAPPKTGPQIPPRGCVGFNIWACRVVPQLRNRRRLGKGCDPIGLYASGLANRTDPGVWQPATQVELPASLRQPPQVRITQPGAERNMCDWAHQDLNLGPRRYQRRALPTEL